MSRSNISCDCEVIHEEMVEKSKIAMPLDEEVLSVAKLFKVLGDNTRCRIVFSLIDIELCVCDICSLLNMTKSAISHQLSTLKQAHVVKSRREGKSIYYSLDDRHVKDIIRDTLVHIKHTSNDCHCIDCEE